jgi:methylphosphotriester-DNA--protein-cysteine methyltransferase
MTFSSNISGLIECPLCGRSAGAIGKGERACQRCRSELSPTHLQAWREAIGMTVEQLAELVRVTPMTVHRALRGEPMGKRTAQRLGRVTGISAELLRAGEPSPFARRV